MSDPDQWRSLISDGMARRPPPLIAQTPFKRLGGFSQAALVQCNDSRRYVIKGPQTGRTLIADQVVGRLGAIMGAPVADVALVDVSPNLIQSDFALMHFSPGLSHGSAFLEGCYDGWDIEHVDDQTNRARYAVLALLYGMSSADDHQFIYEKAPPHLVHSVDHGHFFAGAPNWTIADLRNAPPATPDAMIVDALALTPHELYNVGSALTRVTNDAIADAVASPPDSWGISMAARIALAQYLADRRDALVTDVLYNAF